MIKLSDKPNVEAPSGSYNYGRLIDDDGSGNGTPVNRLVYDDMHQFFESLMAYGEVTANGLPDSDDDGYQLMTAFLASTKRGMGSLLGILAESMIGDPTSPISAIAPYILLGIVDSGSAISVGYIYFNQELFFCGGHSGVISDTAVFTKIAPNVLQITDAVSGSGDFDFADLLTLQTLAIQNPSQVRTKKINIGDWNMFSSGGGSGSIGKSVAHGLTFSKIIGVNVFIRDDSGTTLLRPIDFAAGGEVQILLTNVDMGAFAAGVFDNNSYNLTPFNRGYIIIQYLP